MSWDDFRVVLFVGLLAVNVVAWGGLAIATIIEAVRAREREGR